MDSDYIERFHLPWCFREDSPRVALSHRAFVINLDNKGREGTHWTAARLVGDTLYYADPFGTMLSGWPPRELEGVAKRQVINRVSFQRPSSKLCGYYAICFALAMDFIDRPLTRDQFEEVLYRSIR